MAAGASAANDGEPSDGAAAQPVSAAISSVADTITADILFVFFMVWALL
jgi:hypothetical protein